MKRRVVMSWSGGKDAALSLYEIAHSDSFECVGLLTTVTREYDRVTMHGVRRSLIEKQAIALETTLNVVHLPADCSMEDYSKIMKRNLSKYKEDNVRGFAFGDTLLEDVRRYREEMLASEGFEAYFLLWERNTTDLLKEFIKLGFKAIITCVDGNALDPSYLGRELDEDFIESLPEDVDPSGENGEYHSFVFDGPIFHKPIPVKIGEVEERKKGGKKFYYCDLRPK